MLHKRLKKIFCGGMFAMLVLCSAAPAAALPSKPLITNTEEEYLVNHVDYPKGVYAAMTAYERSDYRKPIASTQARHVQGASLTIGIERGYSYGISASAALEVSIGKGISAGIADLANIAFLETLSPKFGIGASVSLETVAKIVYTLDGNSEPGYYRLVEVYPVKSLTLEVVGYDSSGNRTVLTSESISYAPKLSGAYITLESYDPDGD